ncbi:TlyA family RNA methyltransferase [Candidatus Parcubacteria bacterium]|nr:MAG: TlyA family RNA methyltransferase [Candidatus Parcubacteria bacterium]
MAKRRLDAILIGEHGVPDANAAFVLVTEGRVFINGQKAVSPAQTVAGNATVEVRQPRAYVGRAAYKLEAALEHFGISVDGMIAADVGAATGGFVEVLVKRGAKKVYAIDTARGKLDLKIREHPRVFVMEGTDARAIDRLPDPIDIVSMDVSLISLRQMLGPVRQWLAPDASVIVLLKPQYEAEPGELKHGIVRLDAARERIVRDFRAWCSANGWQERGMIESPIRGTEGNIEYLFWLQLGSIG